MKILALVLVLLVSSQVHAQTCPAAPADPIGRTDVKLTWTATTQNTDGTAVAQPVTYKVYEIVGTGPTLRCTTVASATSAGQLGLSVGLHSWNVSAVAAGQESALSNAASKTIAPGTPNPPGGLTATGNLLAYTLKKSHNQFALVPVGHVAPGTQCDLNQPVLGMFAVPRESVTWAGLVRPQVVVASCG
jgi:hypothetical protein